MMQSIDGKIACDMVDKISGDEYYTALDSLKCTAFIEGKHSYQIHYCGFEEFQPSVAESVNKECVHVAKKAESYSVSLDTRGTLLWDETGNDGRLCIVSEQASPEYLKYLEAKGISYIATGKQRIDLARAMEILRSEFGVERVAVVGGGKINGGFLAAGLIDEVSAMIAPGIDGRTEQPALFDGIQNKEGFLPTALAFNEVTTFPNGVIWARYKVVNIKNKNKIV
jgi:riboflavin biosynthesis pyrimidine reductase